MGLSCCCDASVWGWKRLGSGPLSGGPGGTEFALPAQRRRIGLQRLDRMGSNGGWTDRRRRAHQLLKFIDRKQWVALWRKKSG